MNSERIARIALTAGVIVILAGTNAAAQDQDWRRSFDITAEHLQEVGLHLPSYMPGVQDLLKYEGSLPTHQEITVDWDSLPGQVDILKREEARRLTLSPDFVVTRRRRKLSNAVRCICTLHPDDIVIAGVDAQGQLLGLTEVADGRVIRGLPGIPGALVRRHLTFTFNLPDDPQIKKAVVFKPDSREEGGDGHRLVRVGEIDLQATNSTGAVK